jgi:hypothetical protein
MEKTELAMNQRLTKKTQSKRLSDEAEIDSIDSLICAWGTHMRMTFSHAHVLLSLLFNVVNLGTSSQWRPFYFMPRRGDYESVLSQDSDDTRKMAYIKGGKSRNKTSG